MGSSLLLQVPASAAGLYPSGSAGFDISYPNCAATPPSGDTFALVGLGGGRPFTTNSCLGQEWHAALAATGGATPSLYFNTGYAGAYTRNIDSTCQAALSSARSEYPALFSGLNRHALAQAQQAWELGCSEADYAHTQAPTTPAMWWADVETGNSWSSNHQLNDYTLDGISYQMGALGGGGIYSSPGMWAGITGSSTFQPTPAATANWIAGGSCTTTFGQTATWLVQNGTAGGVDSDTGC